MAKDYSKMNLYQLIIERERLTRERSNLDSIIEKESEKIFDKINQKDYSNGLNQIINSYL